MGSEREKAGLYPRVPSRGSRTGGGYCKQSSAMNIIPPPPGVGKAHSVCGAEIGGLFKRKRNLQHLGACHLGVFFLRMLSTAADFRPSPLPPG